MTFAYCSNEISQEGSKKMNFYKRSYQPILRYLCTEAIKRPGEISLHRHFKQYSLENFRKFNKEWFCIGTHQPL